MANLLISVLGRGPYRPDGSRGDYRSTRYAFSRPGDAEPWVSPATKHFAHAACLFQESQPDLPPFDEVILLGTSGSMWDVLADSFGADSETGLTETVMQLCDRVDAATIDQATLDRYAEELNAGRDRPLRLLLIPSAVDLQHQAEILNQIEGLVDRRDRVWLDVTHGFRHLPMIGLAASALVSSQKRAEIVEIAYGALDMTRDGQTPVVSLTWILNLLRANSGMTEMIRHQNPRPLIDCFPPGPLRESLDDIAYKLDVMRIDEAALAARAAIKQLESSLPDLSVDLQLLAGVLRDRLDRYARQSRTVKGLTQMARLALDQDDFLRASIFLSEAVDLADKHNVPGDIDQDDRLKAVRHWLAHAGKLNVRREDRQVREWVSSRGNLRQFLSAQVDRLSREVKGANA